MTRQLTTLALGTLMASTLSFGGLISAGGILSGANENPSVASAGTGTAAVRYDSIAHTLAINVTFSGLNPLTSTSAPSGTTASHIHCCVTAPGGNAGVATTTPTFAGFPLGVLSGSYSVVLDLTQSSSWNAAFITGPIAGGTIAGAEAALAAGLAAGTSYLNIHTTAFGGGEIRAFLTPEPGTMLSLATGLIGLFTFARRRRRA